MSRKSGSRSPGNNGTVFVKGCEGVTTWLPLAVEKVDCVVQHTVPLLFGQIEDDNAAET